LKIIILGASGLLGSTLFKTLIKVKNFSVYGTVRSFSSFDSANKSLYEINDFKSLEKMLTDTKPHVLINCIGITNKKSAERVNLFQTNSIFPHQILCLSKKLNFRFIQISTDCVFSGIKGFYSELDLPDPIDDYGLSKLLGETNFEESLVIRTSFIGHELNSKSGLLDWFLSQNKKCKGYKNAIFSGLTTLAFAEIIEKIILAKKLTGIYHVAANPISKFDLLSLIAEIYNKKIEIEEDTSIYIDRSLNASKFNTMFNYQAPLWPELIYKMFESHN
jgi:dTDP-4-dehydrorhamnose reductase